MRKKDVEWIKSEFDILKSLIIAEGNKIDILKGEIKNNEERDYFKDNDLVILVKERKTRVYCKGDEITDGITNVSFYPGEVPVIEYQKIVR